MSKKFIWLSTITLVLALFQSSFACTGSDKHCKVHHQFDQLAKELNLTMDQKAKIKAYREQTYANFKTNYAQLRSLRQQINNLVKADILDEVKLDSLIEQINKIRGSMLKRRVMMQHEMYTLLNEKQKAKLLELKKKWLSDHNG